MTDVSAKAPIPLGASLALVAVAVAVAVAEAVPDAVVPFGVEASPVLAAAALPLDPLAIERTALGGAGATPFFRALAATEPDSATADAAEGAVRDRAFAAPVAALATAPGAVTGAPLIAAAPLLTGSEEPLCVPAAESFGSPSSPVDASAKAVDFACTPLVALAASGSAAAVAPVSLVAPIAPGSAAVPGAPAIDDIPPAELIPNPSASTLSPAASADIPAAPGFGLGLGWAATICRPDMGSVGTGGE